MIPKFIVLMHGITEKEHSLQRKYIIKANLTEIEMLPTFSLLVLHYVVSVRRKYDDLEENFL
jgi:uncharacterized membrane protein (GlpM family)